MKHIALLLALLSLVACDKKDDAAKAASAEFATVDCEKMTTHNTALILKDAIAGKSPEEAKLMEEKVKGSHAEFVKACEDEKGTKKLTRKQYDCILASATTAEMTACVVPAK